MDASGGRPITEAFPGDNLAYGGCPDAHERSRR
jgi:hypothetical protein